MIACKGLSRGYDDGARGRVEVLAGVDLTVAEGEFLAVVGRSGSGKSTLLNVLGGLDTAWTGAVHVDGLALAGLADEPLSRYRNEKVGFVFQSFHLVEGLSVLENVALPAFFGDAELTEAQLRQASALLDRVGLGGKAERLPGALSGGERQRVAIARALFRGPRVLLCDEPTGNLDAETADGIVSLFGELNRAGLTVVCVTHEDRLRAAARRVLTLEAGRLS